ncbi:hypothetical protein FOA52_004647 [Chlamydomonas sp. UWO 241]|nr:hypothetical protein FOA52_004647 [Chlamydomonas sp. UWO 241]
MGRERGAEVPEEADPAQFQAQPGDAVASIPAGEPLADSLTYSVQLNPNEAVADPVTAAPVLWEAMSTMTDAAAQATVDAAMQQVQQALAGAYPSSSMGGGGPGGTAGGPSGGGVESSYGGLDAATNV